MLINILLPHYLEACEHLVLDSYYSFIVKFELEKKESKRQGKKIDFPTTMVLKVSKILLVSDQYISAGKVSKNMQWCPN